MAEKIALDDLTKCPICFDTYDKPRCLPCLHTFCEKCLQQFINRTDKEDKTETMFLCPICRCVINVPCESKHDSSEIASRFPTNHLIVTLMDSNFLHDSKNVCGPCHKRSIEAEAVSWCIECKSFLCQQCLEYHSTLPVLETHSTGPLKDAQLLNDGMSSSLYCKTHPEKRLEMYCEDHELPCCLTCTMIDHRRCEKVDTLENASKGVTASKLKDEMEVKLDGEMKRVREKLSSKKADEKHLLENCKEIELSIENTTERLTEQLKKLSTKALHELSEFQEKHRNIILSDIEFMEERKRTIENYQTLLRVSKGKISNVQFFLEAQRLKGLFDKGIEFGSMKQSIEMKKTPRFETEGNILDLLTVEAFGRICFAEIVEELEEKKKREFIEGSNKQTKDTKGGTNDSKIQEIGGSSFCSNNKEDVEEVNGNKKDKKDVCGNEPLAQKETYSQWHCELLKKVTLKTSNDNSAVHNCLFMDDGRLVTVDYKVQDSKDGIIKIFDHDFLTFKTVSIRGKPWAAIALNSQILALTIPSRDELCFMEIDSHRKRYQECDRKYFGLALKDMLVPSPNALDNLNDEKCTFFLTSKGYAYLRTITGVTLMQISLSKRYVRNIFFIQDRIYFMDDKSVGCMHLHGEFLFRYRDGYIGSLSGLAFYKPNDEIAICGERYGGIYSVIKLDMDGNKRAEEVLDELSGCNNESSFGGYGQMDPFGDGFSNFGGFVSYCGYYGSIELSKPTSLAFSSTYDKLCLVNRDNVAFVFLIKADSSTYGKV